MQDEDTNVNLLKQEYALLAQEVSQAHARIDQLVTVGTSVLAVTVGLMSSTGLKAGDILVKRTIAWVAPLLVLTIFGIALITSFRTVSSVMQIRLVTDRLLQLTGEPAFLFYYHEKSIASRFQSLRRGNVKFRALWGALILIACILYVSLLALSFPSIYGSSHFAGFVFILLHGCLASGFLLILSGIYYDLPQLYYKAVSQAKSGEGTWLDVEALIKSAANPFRLLLPRPIDFVTKTFLFALGVIVLLWENSPVFNPRIWTLFITEATTDPPPWTIVAFALCWYLIQEGIVQQAKYIWNDIRDRQADTEFEGKCHRAVTSGAISLGGAIAHLMVRWFVGLLLGLMLDHRLFWLLSVISFTQILYELWAKPHGTPVVAVGFVALGSSLRVLGGALSVGANYLDPRLAMLVATAFFYGIGYIATFWRVEARYFKEKQISISPRPQSEFFYRSGESWQHFGFAGMLLCAVFLLIDALSALLVNERISAQGLSLLQARIGLPDIMILVVEYLTIMMVMLGVTWIVRRPFSKLLSRLAETRRFVTIVALVALTMVVLVVGPAIPIVHQHHELLSSTTLLSLSIIAILSYEKMTYERFMLVHLLSNLKTIKCLWSSYLFSADSGLPFAVLLKATARLVVEDRETVERKLAQEGVLLPELTG